MNRNASDSILFELDSGNPRRKISRNFELREFASKCGSGQVLLHPALIDALQMVRDRYGKPIRITSGYRSLSHNRSIGGAPNSLHTLGMAADLSADDLPHLEVLCRNFGLVVRPYYERGFIHVDVGAQRNW